LVGTAAADAQRSGYSGIDARFGPVDGLVAVGTRPVAVTVGIGIGAWLRSVRRRRLHARPGLDRAKLPFLRYAHLLRDISMVGHIGSSFESSDEQLNRVGRTFQCVTARKCSPDRHCAVGPAPGAAGSDAVGGGSLVDESSSARRERRAARAPKGSTECLNFDIVYASRR
jgi:hypothetical protein